MKIRTVIPRPQVHHPAGIGLLARESVTGLGAARRLRKDAVGIVRVRQRDLSLSVGELARRAEGVGEEVVSGCVHLGDSTKSIDVLVCSIVQHLRET